jgi:hypothetical protein
MPPNYALRPWPGQISLEIINLQREARRLARQVNPDFFTFTEGGGYQMATVNDFTHTWHGSTAPPLPPFRMLPLSPEEEAGFLRDEVLSMIPGARAWSSIANAGGEDGESAVRPRVLFTLFGGRMPVLRMFDIGMQSEVITNEPEFWKYFRPRPADDPAPQELALWRQVQAMWQVRMAHPELKSGLLDVARVQADDAAVFAFLRLKDDAVTVVAINFRPAPVTCTLMLATSELGLAAENAFAPTERLTGVALPATTGAMLATGYPVTLGPRDGVVIKLR